MRAGRPLRVAFAGDAVRFAAWVPGGVGRAAPPSPLAATFVDTRDCDAADAAAALRAARPDVVVALGVAEHDPAALGAAGVPVLGVVAPAERPIAPSPDGEDAERALLWAPGSPGRACDRLVALDPRAALGGRLWRTIAPPVDDALFAPARRARRPPRIVFAAPSTEHRERWLAAAKHEHDVRHVAHGITPDRLPGLLDATDVALCAAPTEQRSFDHRVALHLAAGHLVVAEPMSPGHGLEPGIDLLTVAGADALARTLAAIRAAPDTHRRVKVRGRLKAEAFRASRVWARVLDDLLRDVDAFGRGGR